MYLYRSWYPGDSCMILVLVYFQCISATGYEDNSEHSHAYAHRNTAICLSAHAHESHYITCTQQKTVEIQVGQDSRCQFIWNNNYAHSITCVNNVDLSVDQCWIVLCMAGIYNNQIFIRCVEKETKPTNACIFLVWRGWTISLEWTPWRVDCRLITMAAISTCGALPATTSASTPASIQVSAKHWVILL